jgi:PAS domain S-box-containing protein
MHDQGVALNVNDDDATRYILTRTLQQAGFSVVEAATGTEALAAARRLPDIVVLDVQLPDISGLDVCRRLKADPVTREIPVLQTSATFVSSERKVAGLDSGADAYLAQPIEPMELVATVQALLRARRAERDVQEISREWKRTFDVIADGIAVIDAQQLGIVRCNRAMAEVFEHAAATLAGRRLTDVASGHGTALVDVCERAIREKRRVVSEALVREKLWRLVADPMNDEEGRVERLVLLIADITEHRQLEEDHRQRAIELTEASRRKDEFLGMLAHELRNPLHALAAALSLMERAGPQDAQSIKLRSSARRQTHHLGRLVDDLLEVSRITRGKIRLQRETCDLRTVLRSAVEQVRPLCQTRSQRLTVDLPAEPLTLSADALRLEQVFANLLHNAAKYSEPGTDIELRCTAERGLAGAQAVVTVVDHGVGIPPAQLTSIFEPFVQVDASLARSLGGLGIGLTVARAMVELHGGAIAADSDGPGRGSQFRVELPLDDRMAPALPRPENDESVAVSPARTILLVEDNVDSREMLSAWLSELGHTVHTAATGPEAIALARQHRPQIVLLDIGLPTMDGYEVARALREHEDTREAVIVAVTGYGRPEDFARARDEGIDGHIVKPVQPDALARLIHLPRRMVRDSFARKASS